MKTKKLQSRFFAFVLCLSMLLTLAVTDSLAASAVKPASTVDPMVRVLLRRLNVTDRIDLVLESPYGLTLPNKTHLHFRTGTVLSFRLRHDEMYLYYEDMSARVGDDCLLERYAVDNPDAAGFQLTNVTALYKGDLRLKVEEGKILPILSIHVEDYLQGVVPYEMSDYFPLEALKAQTVAARTYVLRKRNPDKDYDVVDTTADQVFKGYLDGYPKSLQAIRETAGVCGFFRDKLAQCYYSASNGGRTELVETVWRVKKEDYAYYASVNDPYDLENPSSSVRRLTLNKSYTNKNKDVAPYGLRMLLVDILAEDLTSRGLDIDPDSIQVVEIHSLTLNNVPDSENFKAATTISLEVTLKGRTREDDKPGPGVVITILDTNTPGAEGEVLSVSTPAPTQEPTYGPFELIDQRFQVEIPIFPLAEEAFGMDISPNYENEIWTLAEKKDGYVLEARRYGHGVGMSQRGAEWMASKYGKTYEDILLFYYPGMDLKRYEYEPVELPEASEELRATMGPALSPTPLPTLMPLSLKPEKGQWVAVVTGIADDSSLNLRAQPSLGGEILMRLYKYQRLLVLERAPEEGWVKVRTDDAEGYVMESYLSKE
ncbi:MAG: SpoIID/LytB domain-containing protein [Clostridia bacterium]|nr:SpoIID/LytB domain-containing protein [Clostridia bacterium]